MNQFLLENLRKAFLFFTVLVICWLIFRLITAPLTMETFTLLVYAGFAFIVVLQTQKVEAPQPAKPEAPQKETEEDIILRIIREKGKAKRRDLLPLVNVSKATLGRLLDKMEADGLIVQNGARKACFYTIREQNRV